MVPARILPIAELPLTSSGKVRMWQLSRCRSKGVDFYRKSWQPEIRDDSPPGMYPNPIVNTGMMFTNLNWWVSLPDFWSNQPQKEVRTPPVPLKISSLQVSRRQLGRSCSSFGWRWVCGFYLAWGKEILEDGHPFSWFWISNNMYIYIYTVYIYTYIHNLPGFCQEILSACLFL